MGYAIEGFSTLSQAYISPRIASQAYQRSAILFALAAKAGGADLLQIGRPDEGVYFAGGNVTMAQKQDMTGRLFYEPRIQAFKTNNTRVTGANDTMPVTATPSTKSHSQAPQAGAKFNWMMYLDTPIELRNVDLDLCAAEDTAGNGISAGRLTEDASEVAMMEHTGQLAARLLYGAPSNQFVLPCDDLQGVLLAGDPTLGYYGCVDRASLSAGDPWLPATGTANGTYANLDIYELVEDMNITKRMGVIGQGVNLILLGGDNFRIAKRQILQRDRDAGILTSGAAPGVAKMAAMGVEKEILRVNNCWVMHEPFLDVCEACQYQTTTPLYTAQPTTIIGLNLAGWRYVTNRNYNAKVVPFVDLADKARGAPNVKQGFIRSVSALICERPSVCVAKYVPA